MGGWEFPLFIHKGIDIEQLDDGLIVYYHDNLHILWSRLEKGYKFEWTFFEIYRMHTLIVRDMAGRGINHLSPINDLDKTQFFSELDKFDVYSIEKKLDGIPLSIHKKDSSVKIFFDKDVRFDVEDLIIEIKKLNEKDFILDGDLLLKESGKSEIYIRDIIYLDNSLTKLPFEKRSTLLDNFNFTERVKRIDSRTAGNKEDLKKAILWASSLEGSEGAIVRTLNENYLTGKSISWKK